MIRGAGCNNACRGKKQRLPSPERTLNRAKLCAPRARLFDGFTSVWWCRSQRCSLSLSLSLSLLRLINAASQYSWLMAVRRRHVLSSEFLGSFKDDVSSCGSRGRRTHPKGSPEMDRRRPRALTTTWHAKSAFVKMGGPFPIPRRRCVCVGGGGCPRRLSAIARARARRSSRDSWNGRAKTTHARVAKNPTKPPSSTYPPRHTCPWTWHIWQYLSYSSLIHCNNRMSPGTVYYGRCQDINGTLNVYCLINIVSIRLQNETRTRK